MSFHHARARQPEIIRAVQKDLTYTNEISEDFSDILKLAGPRNWIRYNNVCKLLAEIAYHGFASVNNLQTLGEEYTGIIQVNNTYVSLPNKLLQLISIILEFGGDALYLAILTKLEKEVCLNDEFRPEAKTKLIALISFMKTVSPYVKALHKTFFYLNSGKYQMSKRLTGINYVLIRRWLQPNHSLYGYKILGVVTFLQLTISLILNLWEALNTKTTESSKDESLANDVAVDIPDEDAPPCNLCWEPRKQTSLTPCGHLFCWNCIMEWLDEKDVCPVCREQVKKSAVFTLLNYS